MSSFMTRYHKRRHVVYSFWTENFFFNVIMVSLKKKLHVDTPMRSLCATHGYSVFIGHVRNFRRRNAV